MSYYAKITGDNLVEQVLVIDFANEEKELTWLEENFSGQWLKTYRAGEKPVRGKSAAPGMLYSPELDAFHFPQPFSSWSFDETKLEWEAPVAKPNDGKEYDWNEETLSWEPIDNG